MRLFTSTAIGKFRSLLAGPLTIHSKDIIVCICLLALNLLLAARLIRTEYLDEMPSLEGFYFALANFIKANPIDGQWWPYWYNGMPFTETYQPLLHVCVALFSRLTRLPVPLSFHAVEGVLYALGPVSLYYLSRSLGTPRHASAAGALVYSLFSPSIILFSAIRLYIGDVFGLQRLHTMVRFADGPHVVSLTLVPIALAVLLNAVSKRTIAWCAFSALTLALVPLTNWPGALVLLCGSLAIVATSCFGRPEHSARIIFTAVVCAVWAYCIACHWMLPSTVAVTLKNTQAMAGQSKVNWQHAGSLAGLLVGYLTIGGVCYFKSARRDITFWSLFCLPFFVVVAGFYWFGFSLILQPWRFHLALEMALVGLAVSTWHFWLRKSYRKPALLVFACFGLFIFERAYVYSRKGVPRRDITSTSEYKVGNWLNEHGRGRRAILPGSVSLWLNAFTATPQVAGCCEQTARNKAAVYAQFIYQSDLGAEGREGEISLAWLKALGVQWVVACGPESTEAYHAMKFPLKFRGLLPEVWRDDTGDVIYEIPDTFANEAQIIASRQLPARMPGNGIDIDPLIPYIRAIQDSVQISKVRWMGSSNIFMDAAVSRGDVATVHVAYNQGWRASCGGIACAVHEDNLGQLYVVPNHPGYQTIHLFFDGGTEAFLTRLISTASIAIALAYLCIFSLRFLLTSHKTAE